jgi:hypothetical protein
MPSRRRLALGRTAAGQNHARAAPGDLPAGLEAHAAVAAGDDRDLARCALLHGSNLSDIAHPARSNIARDPPPSTSVVETLNLVLKGCFGPHHPTRAKLAWTGLGTRWEATKKLFVCMEYNLWLLDWQYFVAH